LIIASSKAIDKIDYDRYGWLKPEDIEVINSMALPLGRYICMYVCMYVFIITVYLFNQL